jgi:hypothetical protein
VNSKRRLEAEQRAVFTGVLECHGYWFGPPLSTEEARRRALREYRQGDQLYRTSLGLVSKFRSPRSIDTRSAPAAPLVNVRGTLTSCPFVPEPVCAVLLMQGGVRHAFAQSQLQEVALFQLLDLGGFGVEAVETLGDVAAPRFALPKLEDPTVKMRADLGIGEKEQEARARLVAELQQSATAAATPRWRERLMTWFKRRPERSLGHTSTRAGGLAGHSPSGRFRRWFDRFLSALERRLFLGLFANKHAEHLSKLFELLERRDDAEALRHAIPLANDTNSPAGPRLPLSAPEPRNSFEIRLARPTYGSSLGIGAELFARLRAYYEKLFQRLDQSGRHEEAAFVLVELLDQIERAVSYLEQKERFGLAAELAEARRLPPSSCVRLWFLADDWKRAFATAVRHDCFADAIDRLERSNHRAEAAELRLRYADRLASAGQLVSAAELVADISGSRHLSLNWLESARAGGETRGIALELELAPERFADVWQSLGEVLEHDAGWALEEQRVLADALLERPLGVTAPIVRALARRLIAAAASSGSSDLKTAAKNLAEASGGALLADFPDIPKPDRTSGAGPVVHTYRRNSAGTQRLFDACRIHRHWVLALGEGGVALLDKNGRELRRFDVPATALVVAPGSQHVLALAERGSVRRISRIHLGTRRSEAWGDFAFRNVARIFDGQRWFVEQVDGNRHRLTLIDAAAAEPEVIESVPLGSAEIRAIQLGKDSCQVLLGVPGYSHECAEISVADCRLRKRAPLDLGIDHMPFTGAIALCEGAQPVVLERWFDFDAGALGSGDLVQAGCVVLAAPIPDALEGSFRLETGGDLFALSAAVPDARARIVAGSISRRAHTLDVVLDGLQLANLRLLGDTLYVCSSDGCAFAFDVARGDEIGRVRL